MRGRREERGSATLETALMLPFLLFITLGVFSFSYVSYVKTAATEAARSAAREAAVKYDVPKEDYRAAGTAAAHSTLSLVALNPHAADVSVKKSGSEMRATVTYPIPEFVHGVWGLLTGGRYVGAVHSEATAKVEPDYLGP